jgi:hypothetical protein
MIMFILQLVLAYMQPPTQSVLGSLVCVCEADHQPPHLAPSYALIRLCVHCTNHETVLPLL